MSIADNLFPAPVLTLILPLAKPAQMSYDTDNTVCKGGMAPHWHCQEEARVDDSNLENEATPIRENGDARARTLTLRYPGTGLSGAWTERDRQVYRQLLAQVSAPLLAQIGRRGGPGIAFYSAIGALLALGRLEPGPDGTRLAFRRPFPRGAVAPGTTGWTWGNTIILDESRRGDDALLLHEYVHVLQYRCAGLTYIPNYARQGLYNWSHNAFEKQAVLVEGLYRAHPWLPPLWEI